MEVPEESFHWSSWDSRTCYPQRAFIQGLTDDYIKEKENNIMKDEGLGKEIEKRIPFFQQSGINIRRFPANIFLPVFIWISGSLG